MIPAHNYQLEGRIVRARIVLMFIITIVLCVVLILRVGYLQIAQHQKFSELARNNRINQVPLPPIRGLIYDRNGEILAQNFHSYNLEILPDQVSDMPALLAQLGKLVELTAEGLERFEALLKRRPSFERQTLRANLSEQEASRLAVDLHRYSGVELKARLQRNYPKHGLTTHVVGYVGRINPDDLKQIDNQKYRGLDYIGKSGIEAFYEPILLGKPGVERVETNAHGKIIRRLEQTAADAGETIHLSLDIDLQQKALEALAGYEGAVVAIAPATGDVLAFASMPGYDPNLFVNGISKQDYALLRTSERLPLLNRALYGRYSPASTIKSFMALVGIENGVNPNKKLFCGGYYSLPGHKHRYRDWKKSGHGMVDAADSIEQSCDVYFYRLARQLGIDNIHNGLSRYGFGQPSGIDLPEEPSGLLPSRDWKRRARGQVWLPGETIITGIGQGYMLATPLQLAAATATLANRGKQVTPRFLIAIENPQSQARQELPPQVAGFVETHDAGAYDYVIRGMREVVHGKHGTARTINRGIRYQMAGKTGTVQLKTTPQDSRYREQDIEKKYRDHSLFIAFAPIDNPKIAIAVVIEHGGNGSRIAAPVARKLIDYYLLERLGLFPEATVNAKAELAGSN